MTPIAKLFSSLTRKKDPRWQNIADDRRQQLLEFQRTIGVRFRNPAILNQSLMHRSYIHGKASADRHASNERMEFLGDSVLGLVVNDHLYARFPDRDEGDLTKIKSLVVSRTVLAKKAQDIGLGKYLLLSAGESESGGRRRISIIADAMEAVIGAVYLDQGLEASREFIRREFLVGLHEITGAEENTNYKSLLQELVQGSRKVHPVYRIQSERGPDHEKLFIVDVSISGKIYGRGTGHSKKEAEQSAAKAAMENLADRDRGRPAAESSGREGRRDEETGRTAERARPQEPSRSHEGSRSNESARSHEGGRPRDGGRSHGGGRGHEGGRSGDRERHGGHAGQDRGSSHGHERAPAPANASTGGHGRGEPIERGEHAALDTGRDRSDSDGDGGREYGRGRKRDRVRRVG